MPVHDWTTVTAGIFHDFHQSWAIEIRRALNGGVLPPGYSAMAEQWAGGKIPDVLTLQSSKQPRISPDDGGVATLAPPATKIVHAQSPAGALARRANRIAIRHRLGRVVAVIELVSPGNKESKREIRQFVEKTVDFLARGVHVLLVDLFPPTSRDPNGLHSLIGDELAGGDVDEVRDDKPLSFVSYQVTEDRRTARIEHRGVGDALPDMPIYLTPDEYVMVPLESTYLETWRTCPEVMREAVETGVMPDEDGEDE